MDWWHATHDRSTTVCRHATCESLRKNRLVTIPCHDVLLYLTHTVFKISSRPIRFESNGVMAVSLLICVKAIVRWCLTKEYFLNPRCFPNCTIIELFQTRVAAVGLFRKNYGRYLHALPNAIKREHSPKKHPDCIVSALVNARSRIQ